MPTSTVFNAACEPDLIHYPDNFWDIAIVDVPYGIDATNMKLGENKNARWSGTKPYKRGDWDGAPPGPEYWLQLFRVSRHQIVWGANHFISRLAPFVDIDTPSWVIWDKHNGDTSFADCEMAWTSFNKPARMFKYMWSGFLQERMGERKEERIHPTQKPVYAYRWLLQKYAEPGWKVLDTHMGSQASRVAAYQEGFNYWGWEIDADYFKLGCDRFAIEAMKQTLF